MIETQIENEKYLVKYCDVRNGRTITIAKEFGIEMARKFQLNVQSWEGVKDVAIISRNGTVLSEEEIQLRLEELESRKNSLASLSYKVRQIMTREVTEKKIKNEQKESNEMRCPHCKSNEVMKIKKKLMNLGNEPVQYQCLNIDCWNKFEEKKTDDILLFRSKYAIG